ncbi:hypothetical protein ACIBJE_02240 [Micromonospora sp. NPDC050187]|uniref:hypothetical protein n=1 Tax=Micromonospora sp. NPDC050187 TaxID=3364277 RepID=UPI0037918B2A
MITLDALDRDILAGYAAGTPMADLVRQWNRRQRVVRVCFAAGLDPRRASRLVRLYDSLAAAPVVELSPIRRPGRAVPERLIQGRATAWPVLNRKEIPTR